MKTMGLFLCLSMGILTAAHARENLWENFDAYPVGSIAAQPGWARASWLNTQTAQVSTVQAHSPSHSLELPWNANGCSAAYTNFLAAYDPASNHPVIRCSAKLFLQNTNIALQFGLRNATDGAALSFLNTNGYGLFGFTNYDVVFIPLATGRFVDVTMFYNRSNNFYRLDYDYTNRLAWGTNNAASPLVHTQFNQFVVARLTNAAPATGAVLLDDVRVETFPPHVWAWWRCDDTGMAFVEQLGCFKPTRREDVVGDADDSSSNPGYDGQDDCHNETAMRQLYTLPADCAMATPSTTNWTAEAVFRIPPGQQNVSFFDCGKASGFDTNGAWISFGFHLGWQSFYYNVRDAQQTDTSYANSSIGTFVPDGRWHHIAFVKTNADLKLYLDYKSVTTHVMPSTADGAFSFDTQTHACIGQSLNGGNKCGDQTLIDEVRFSGKALSIAEFLQPGKPLIASINNAEPWHVAIKGILGRTYRFETSPSMGADASWTFATNLAMVSTFGTVDLPYSAKTNFLRVIREE